MAELSAWATNSQYKSHVDEYKACFKKHTHTITAYNNMANEITKNAKACNEARKKLESPINAMVIGIMNHGKSTMLNALLDNTDNSLFKVADKRETREIQHEERENICWTDTPGFAADKKDSNKALAGIEQLEVGFFVHKASVGELHANEVEVLRKISKNRTEAFLKNTCIVLNDDICNDKELKMVSNKMTEQCNKFLDTSLPIFVCNPKSYQKGLRENKKILAGKSGITELRNWIEGQCRHLKKEQDTLFRTLKSQILRTCKIAIKGLEKEIQKLERQIQLAKICSDNFYNVIKKISNNKGEMRNLKLSNKDNDVLSQLIAKYPRTTSLPILPLWDIIARLFLSDFDKKHINATKELDHYIQELNRKKNNITKSIRDFKIWRNEFVELRQSIQKIYEIWK